MTENIRFAHRGVQFEVTTAQIPSENGRKAGFVFNFGIAILDNQGNKMLHSNALALFSKQKDEYQIISPKQVWDRQNRTQGSIPATIFYANRNDPEQLRRLKEFIAVLIPNLKKQVHITIEKREKKETAQVRDNDWYDD